MANRRRETLSGLADLRVSPGEVKSFVRVRTNFGVGSPRLAAQQHAIRARCSIARFDVAFPHESEVMN